MSVYEVIARTEYRGHRHGETFEATLELQAETRAIRRGAIKLIRRSVPRLVEGSYTLPTQRKGCF